MKLPFLNFIEQRQFTTQQEETPDICAEREILKSGKVAKQAGDSDGYFSKESLYLLSSVSADLVAASPVGKQFCHMDL